VAAPIQLFDDGKFRRFCGYSNVNFLLIKKEFFDFFYLKIPNLKCVSGVITDKNVLPVTQLNFGQTPQSTSFGVHTLGRLECTGSSAPTELPTSCEDLWLNGHTLNGIYSIMGTKMMESVYCDFTKLPDDAGK
jgi:hypothetical protein